MHEFRCPACDARFEALVPIGTETEECRECGAPRATRLLSQPAEPPKFVKSAGGNRRQEAKNRNLKDATKRDFKQKRARARAAAKSRGGSR